MNWSDLSGQDDDCREKEGWRNPFVLDEAEECNAQDCVSFQSVVVDDDDGDNCDDSYFESVPPKRSRMIVQYSDSE